MRSSIPAFLENLGAQVQPGADALCVSMRVGVQRRRAEIPWSALDALSPISDARSYAAEVARGVFAVLNEPSNSKAETLSFLDTTPSILPSAIGPGFIEGVLLAGGTQPFVQPYVQGLELAYFVDLDEGQRLLPLSQVQGWGVHPERVEKAGLSILFHRSGHERWENHLIDGVLVRRLAIGDGADGARGTLMEFFDWQKAQSGRFFAAPSSDLLLFTDDLFDETLRVFRRVVEGAYAKHELPLSSAIYRFIGGKLDPLPRTEG